MSNRQDKKQKLKKYAVFALMGLVFITCIWLIFKPSSDEKEKDKQGIGYNDKIPDPTNNDIIEDKREAYEQASLKERHSKEMANLQDYSSMLDSRNSSNDRIDLIEQDSKPQPQPERQTAIENSVSSYRDINRTLGTFYEKPAYDSEKEEMKKKLQELEDKLADKGNKQSAMDEQIALMEKSYELAARYMPQAQTTGNVQYPNETGIAGDEPAGTGAQELKNKIVKSSKNSNEKVKISPIRQAQDRTVSALKQTYSYNELMTLYDQPRNFSFNTLKSDDNKNDKNTIKACIHGDQTVMSGQSVFIRLLETIVVDDATIPVNTILTANANLQGERLGLQVSSIEYDGVIYPVKISIYDTDGTKGVYVPASMELDALKEVAANMGNSMGTSFTMTDNAGAQIASDLTKGMIQGASQLFAKKIRMVKINLKSGHKVLLYPEKQ
ncbi:MAG TPA: conjugative transposon protein TraM [Dysgonomonas sp.]|uniref:conjugative transposon protein TraM n=1 Tax=unclassified Dysgonomonas TaxID=2630389 RepID=UPI0025C0EA9B|nr:MULTISPECIES: conjugative transposon protein TraM [unclassified Dysgonomonas]HML65212.1 conjugative transposon protein TraM [Dysgonomonas sp.]